MADTDTREPSEHDERAPYGRWDDGTPVTAREADILREMRRCAR